MKQNPQRLIDKFWAGTATAAERQQLAALLETPAGEWHARLRQAFDQPAPTDATLTDEQAARVLRRLHLQLEPTETNTTQPAWWSGWARWAAAALLIMGVALGVYHTARPVATPPVAARPVPQPAWQLETHRNSGAAPFTLPLADGSVLTLQPGSVVRYYAPFGENGRGISLTGDALFQVAKDARHPFTVLANGFTTTALGTRFWVRATQPGQVAVHLLEGKVVVRATSASGLIMPEHFLRPGQQFTADLQTNRVSVTQVAGASAPARRLSVAVPEPQPGLSFEKQPLPAVFTEVSRRYHVQVRYDSAMVAGLSFSGSFEGNDALPVVLGAVCTMNNLAFDQKGKQVTITKSP